MSLFNLIRAPFNALEIKRTERQLSRLVWERGMLSNQPLLYGPLDSRITALMREQARLKNTALVSIPLDFVCHGCQRRHRENVTPERLFYAFSDWNAKHRQPSCRVEVKKGRCIIPGTLGGFCDSLYEGLGRGPWWLNQYLANTDIKNANAASANLTITYASLAASATLVIGRESTAISNTTNQYLDIGIFANPKVGATGAQVGLIQFWAYGSIGDTPVYPTNHTGSDSGVTHTAETRGQLNFWREVLTAATANKSYSAGPRSLAAAFDYIMPQEWGFWVTHSAQSSTNTLNASENTITYLPAYATG